MAVGNLASGYCDTAGGLYVTRGISGFGAGALNALVQISISDFTTLEERGYYFGIVGIAVGLGNGLGPLIGGALTEAAGWRWAFWFICPLALVSVIYLMLVMPGTGRKEGVGEKVGRVDWVGVGCSMVAVVLVLVGLASWVESGNIFWVVTDEY
jgi:MFS family permease